jgi:hypothetical protein
MPLTRECSRARWTQAQFVRCLDLRHGPLLEEGLCRTVDWYLAERAAAVTEPPRVVSR